MKYIKVYAIIAAIVTVFAALPSEAQPSYSTGSKDPGAQLQKLNQFYRYLNSYYVDTINNSKLVEDAIKQMLSDLDPHSTYVSAAEMKDVSATFEGNFSGIGVEFNVLNDTLIVVNTIVGGPAEKVGVQPNDRIIAIDGKPCIGIDRADVPKKLRGPKDSMVEIRVVRRGADRPITFRIRRDNIPITSVDAAYMLNPTTGYIKVNRFAQTTDKEMNDALDKLGKIDGLVLDLRGNGGGLLDQAVDMASLFLKKGSTVVSTEGRTMPPEKFGALQTGRYANGRLIVLIDEGTASASEIVSGALQDWDRALIIGRRSFGKGLVQRQLPLFDGSAVRITIARYHTPTGRVIQRHYEMGHADEYYASFLDRLDQKALDSIPGADSLRYSTLLKHRSVYGGGGIYPDIYVAADTTGYSTYWAELVRGGVISEFVTSYMDSDRAKLMAAYPNFDRFDKDFSIDERTFEQLRALGEKRDVKFDPNGFAVSRERIAAQLKALIAQKLWSTTEYYRIINESDSTLSESERVLQNWNKRAKQIL